MRATRWKGGSAWAIRLLLVGLPWLLAGCGGSGPMWIPAPLVADSSRDVSSNGQDRPFDETLRVDEGAYAELKFSLDSLPSGALSKLVIANGSATTTTENYTLNADKVFRARLVLFVDDVVSDGHIRVEGAFTPGSDCYPNESVRPSCTQTFAGAAIATDADVPAQTLRITERGYYSFDVTGLVKDRIRNGYAGVLRVRSVRDAATNRWGAFVFASKEKVMGQALAHHPQPQLLITLSDAAGVIGSSFITSTVQNSQSDPTLADRDFSDDPHMLANGDPTEIAYALAQPRGIPTGGATMRSFLGQIGTRSYKMTMTSLLDSSVPFSAQNPARIDWYRRAKLNNPNNNNRVITWNNGWSIPPESALITSNPLASGLPAQVLRSDISAAYVDALRVAYVDDASVNFAVAGKTSVQGPVTLQARFNTQTARPPRFTTVITPVPTNNFYTFDMNDVTRAIRYCIGVPGTGAMCDGPPLAVRARMGQHYGNIIVDIRSIQGDTNVPYAAPIHIDVPTSGPSASLDPHPNPDDQALSAGIADAPGYYLRVGAANDVTGSFAATLSMPGHNVRATIHFTNLPLPVASLAGPARVVMPVGASAVSVPADAEVPFVLDVDDEAVNANIDETTKWLFSSSDPSDVMPGEIQQTDGRVNLAMTFGSIGPRTITVRSKGDGRITATFDVVVDGGSRTQLDAQGSIPVFGQPITLHARVIDHSGAPVAAGTIEFRSGDTVLGIRSIEAGSASLTTSALAVGVHLLTARYSGHAATFVAASISPESDYAIDRAGTTLSVSAPASSLVGDPIEVGFVLGVRPPGAGEPGGTVTISDGDVACNVVIGTGTSCTLTPKAAGTRTLLASYSGDTSFLGNSASATITVLERAVLAPSLADERGYVRYGRFVDYALTVRNDGLGAAIAVPVDATLSAAFDGAFARWQCFGSGAGATCATSGTGPLHDVATIPPGRSLTWLISVPVRVDTPDGEATLAIDIGGPQPQQLLDTNQIVLLRDGFDDAYVAGMVLDPMQASALLAGERVHAFNLPPASGRRFDRILLLPAPNEVIEIQQAWIDATDVRVRLLRRDAQGKEHASPWVGAAPDAGLAISALRMDTGALTLLLEGALTPLAITVRGVGPDGS